MKTKTLETLWIVSPCYNDADTIEYSVPVMVETLDRLVRDGKVSTDSRLLLVDDGSADKTWETILRLQETYPKRIEALCFKTNAGEMHAYMAGMKAAAEHADIIVTIDCDLQDDLARIDEMLDKHSKGAEVVYGCRSDRSEDSSFYRICAGSFYFLMRAFGSKIVSNSSSYRLVTRNAVMLLQARCGESPFLQAEIPLLGLTSDKVYYARKARIAGHSGYNYLSLTKLAMTAMKEYTVFFETAALSAAVLLTTVQYIRGKSHGKR
ncbi:MAG: glycosyltransferase [Clostridia bacterium]|nr:glycosyltransferase [Clostridia bacterium]